MSDNARKSKDLSLATIMGERRQSAHRRSGRVGEDSMFLTLWEVEALRRLNLFHAGQVTPGPWAPVQKVILKLLGMEPPIQFLPAAVGDTSIFRGWHSLLPIERSVGFEWKVATTLARVAAHPEKEAHGLRVYLVAIDDTKDHLIYDFDGAVLTVLAIAQHGRRPPEDGWVDPFPFSGPVTPPPLPLMASLEMGRSRRRRDGE